ncbi:hypothetical protein AB0I22_18055 [Streptomyces sp. NPDC050610]|uniref:hypothetical protein n=1 Tax=Streptomyces sp. NPDC050610 TaxID=3157097 RepID=UPI00341C194D
MPDMNGLTGYPGFTELLAVSKDGGSGMLLPTIVVISVVGIAFLAWFLLRGYGSKD